MTELAPLAERIGPDAVVHLNELRQATSRWNIWDDALAAGQITLEEYEREHLQQQRLIEDSTFAAAVRLRRTIDRAAEMSTRAIEAEVRRQRALALALGAVAFLSALIVGWFAWRERILMRELASAVEHEREARADVTLILERITDAFFALDNQWRFTYLNPGGREMLRTLVRRDPDEAIGQSFLDVAWQLRGTRFEHEYRRAMLTQKPVAFEEYADGFDLWFEVHAYPSPEGLSVYFRDVTGRKRAEAERDRLLASEQAALAAAERRQEELQRVTESRTRAARTPFGFRYG
ncbi:MAG: PAS domain-containing protein [Longimicrobiales bacterium]